MKSKNIVVLLLSVSIFSYGQKNTDIQNAYTIEESGYFINPQSVYNGVVVTDNYSNSLFLIKDNELMELVSAPGCGRYYSVSPDKKLIGFKYILDGKQAPALFNLESMQMKLLHKPVEKCSQVSFSENGTVIFSIDMQLFVISDSESKTFLLDSYSNIISISPDGNLVVYSNINDELVLQDLNSEVQNIISEKGKMSAYPQWSPDGKKILFQSGDMYIFDMENSETYNLKEGIFPKWSPNSENIIFYKTKTEKYQVLNSDIFMVRYTGDNPVQLTNSDQIFEMQPSYLDEHTIVYHTYDQREICSAKITNGTLKKNNLIYKHTGNLNIQFFNILKNKAEVRIPGTVPYTHQVYDTPDWHYGHGSCAPSCAIMAISYFNRLPKWPITASSPYTHTSDFGSYVADKYTSDEYYFNVVSQTGGEEDAWGGYGYMWGLGSPNSYMASYITKHYLTSSQLWTSSCTFASTTNEIDNNYPHPMCAMLSVAGHLVLAKGYIVGQHTLIFSEPYGDKNTPGWPSYDGQNAYYDWPGYNNGYQNLDYNGSYGYIPWTVTAQGTEVVYNDTIIDDLFYNHGFNMNNSANSSHMRYFHDANSGYNSHMWFTYTMEDLSDICWVTWDPQLQQSGLYEVLAYIPSQNANASGARYKVHHSGGDTLIIVDQSIYSDEWVSLGTFNFDTSMTSYVYLGDSTGIDGQSIAFDAVKWRWLPIPAASFSANNLTICEGENIQFINSTTNALNYYWEFEGGNPAFSTDETPSVTYSLSGNFDVSLIAFGTNGSDTIFMTDYITVNENAIANFSAIDTIIYLPNAIAIFSNNSLEASSYFWSFGNGMTSTDQNPYCIYNQIGDYTVQLIATNSLCGDDTLIIEDFIHVLNGTFTINNSNKDFSLYPNPFNEFLFIKGYNVVEIKIYDISGCMIHSEFFMDNKSNNHILNLNHLEKGSYILQIKYSDNSLIHQKIIRN
ncbi:MAG: PKD domain-containing protein [Bacteroidota bacterium]